ncbi:MAG: YitT family protein [Solibacillus sp.]
MKQQLFWRISFFLVGVIIISFGITLTIKGFMLGVGSWDVLHMGLADTVGLTIGMWSIILGLTILAIDGMIRKTWPKIGTYLDMFLTGIFIDVFNYLLPAVNGFTNQLIAFLLGLIIFSFGCGMYMVANIGIGPRDTLMVLVVTKLGWSVTKARTIMEVSVAIIGFFLGGPVGVGTVIMALASGPLIQGALTINQKLYYRITGQQSAILN